MRVRKRQKKPWKVKVSNYCDICLSILGTNEYRNSVAAFRRKCQRVRKSALVFIDGTGMRTAPRKLKGLAPRGKPATVVVTKAEKYQPRVDMYGAVSYHGPLACETKTSQERREITNKKTGKKGVKGYTKPMLKDFLTKKLAPKLKRKREEMIVCVDKGLKLNKEEAKEALQQGGAKNIQSVWILPANSAKFVSPLDNSLWHAMKERVRARKAETEEETAEILREEFMGFTATEIKNYYKHCGLTSREDPFKDLS